MATTIHKRKTREASTIKTGTKLGSTAKADTGHDPKKLWVRMYRVGFGDFFLVAVPTQKGSRYILIDCGVHPHGNLGSMQEAVENMAAITDHLSLIIITHRHADHISGFATCAEQFSNFTVDSIWMSGWDDPDNKRASAFQANLKARAMQFQARLGLMANDDEQARHAIGMASLVTDSSNDRALGMLRGDSKTKYHFKSSPKRYYYKGGDQPMLPQELLDAGLVAQLYGPPPDKDFLSLERGDKKGKEHQHEYLDLTDAEPSSKPLLPFGEEWRVPPDEYPTEALLPYSPREFERILEASLYDTLLAAAGESGVVLNNQSLVLLFTLAGKKLLFVGDAEWGNWENFLYGKNVSGLKSITLLHESESILKTIDFYKVGHHGSTNATPIDVVKVLRNGCVAMCSTEPGIFGNEQKGTEVPRKPLLKALSEKTTLVRSDQVSAGKTGVTPGLPKRLPSNFLTQGGKLYIDCEF